MPRTLAVMGAVLGLIVTCVAVAQDEPNRSRRPERRRGAETEVARPQQADFYTITRFPVPEEVMLEAGDVELIPAAVGEDGQPTGTERLAASTRRGEIWIFDKPFAKDPSELTGTLYAQGLHEVLSLAWKDGWLYAMQRPELSRLKDTTGDGRADVVETFADAWGVTGDYHEYAFASKPDHDGNIWITLCLTGSFSSQTEFRGWGLKVTPSGETIPVVSGIRSPGGVGMNPDGTMFFTDNQGPWNGTCSLKHLKEGSFQGHPGGNDWYRIAANMGPRPQDPVSGSRIVTEAARTPEYLPPAILFPYAKMGQSASGVACDTSDGNFGPFAGQMLVGDQTFSTVMRCDLELVDGVYQGACFPFLEGLGSGTMGMVMSSSGSLFVNGTNRGWGSRGTAPFALERIDWTGRTPFEIQTMRATPDGFVLTFTKPVDREAAADVSRYQMPTYTYIFQASYGSPEVDAQTATITKADVAEDGLSVRLTVDGLTVGHVHELRLRGVTSAEGEPMWHPTAYYTLNKRPQ